MTFSPFWGTELDLIEVGHYASDEPSVIEHRLARANGLHYGCPPRHWNWQ